MLFVVDLQRMEGFYRDVLGLTPVEATRQETWIEFEADGAGFSLHAIPAGIAAGIVVAEPPEPHETNPVKLTFEVGDPQAVRERLAALGLPILERSWGGWEAVDPEGNVISIAP